MFSNYGKRILLALRMGKMTAYRLSKEISDGDARVSSGTIYPALQRLSAENMVTAVSHGNRTLYTLTEKGEEYVGELVSMRKSIESKFFSNSMNEAMLSADFIVSLEDLRVIRSVVEDLSESVIDIIRTAFAMKKNGAAKEYLELCESIKEVIGSVRAE